MDRRGTLSRAMRFNPVLSPCVAAGCCAILATVAPLALAQQSYMDEIQDQNASTYEEAWKEDNQIKFPPLPKPDNLVALDAEAIGSGYEYFVDAESLSLGEDKVLRYSVVLESGTGVRNTFYEGIRCETREVKTYGYASRQGGFKSVASSPWKRIRRRGAYAHQHLLAEVYVCDREGWPITEKQVRERLAQNSPSGTRLRRKPFDISN